MGTPALFRARTAREFQQLRTATDVVPLAGREFSRIEHLLIRVPTYGPGGTTPTLRARLLNRAGQPMNDLQVEPSPGPGEQQIDLPLAALPPGEYVVEIRDRRAGRGREGALRFPRDRLMRPGGVVAAASIALAIWVRPVPPANRQARRKPPSKIHNPQLAIRNPQSAIRNRSRSRQSPGCSPSTSARPTRGAASSRTSSRPISSCGQRARLCRSHRCVLSAPAGRRVTPLARSKPRRMNARPRRKTMRGCSRFFSTSITSASGANSDASARRCCGSSIAT